MTWVMGKRREHCLFRASLHESAERYYRLSAEGREREAAWWRERYEMRLPGDPDDVIRRKQANIRYIEWMAARCRSPTP